MSPPRWSFIAPPLTPFVERAIEQTCTEDEDSPCSPRDVGDIWIFNLAMLFGDDSTAPSVEDVLEKGLYQSGVSPVHIVIEGAAEAGSVRCHWRGIAMTLSQREETIRAHLQMDDDKPLPPPDALEAEVLSYLNSGIIRHLEKHKKAPNHPSAPDRSRARQHETML